MARTIFHRIKGVITQAELCAHCCQAPGLMNVCERKNLVSTRLPPEAAPDQADAAQASEFEVFCSTEFGFAAPAGVCGDQRYVKIIIMQP